MGCGLVLYGLVMVLVMRREVGLGGASGDTVWRGAAAVHSRTPCDGRILV
jgi:hypothetical protein